MKERGGAEAVKQTMWIDSAALSQKCKNQLQTCCEFH